MRRWLVLSMILLICAAAMAQEPTQPIALPPLHPPPLPDTGKGWVDFLMKLLVGLWGVLSPMVLREVAARAPVLFAKLPPAVLPIVSMLLGALGGAATGEVTGATAPDTAAVQAGGLALLAHQAVQAQPMKIATKEVKP